MKSFLSRACVAAAALVVFIGTAQAQQYPNQRLTFIVGFAAGGFADSVARIVGEHVSKQLGQPVVVENRGGAGGNIAAKAVADAKSDGYTVLVTTTSLAINASMYKKLDYAPAALVPAAVPVSAPEAIMVPAGKAKTLKEFLAGAKDKDVTFGSAGVGSGSNLAIQYFLKDVAKVKAEHVPFSGGAPAMQATIGGQIDSLATTVSAGVAAQVKEGKLHCLAMASAKRYAQVPECPTFAESGFAGFEASSWVGFFLPPKTDAAIVARLNQAIVSVADDASAGPKLAANGTLMKQSPAETATFVKSEIETWRKMVTATGIYVD